METNILETKVNPSDLAEFVCEALSKPALQITSCHVQPIYTGAEFNSAVYRLTGEAQGPDATLSWSLILKTTIPTAKSSDQNGVWYWKREALAYQSGLLYHLPGGSFTAPKCFDVCERPDGSLWIWLEDIKDDISSPWPIEQYAVVARHLGRFNGGYLAGQVIPSEPWMAHNWVRKYVENAAQTVEFIHSHPNYPTIIPLFPGNLLNQILAVWEERSSILDILENLPQVFCHQDAFRRNLFFKDGRTIAIDWGYAGNAPVGAELAALVVGTLAFFEVPAEQGDDLERLCFESYLQGLREAGCKVDPETVRFGYKGSVLMRYIVGGLIGDLLPRFIELAEPERIEAAFDNKPIGEIQEAYRASMADTQANIQETLELLGMERLISLRS